MTGRRGPSVRPGWWLLLTIFLAACGAPDDAERAADQAYVAGRFRIALDGYRGALTHSGEGRVLAKVAITAARAGALREAAAAYVQLAGNDPSRVPEAADGLEDVARLASRANDGPALADAVLGIRRIAPERLAPRLALDAIRRDVVGAADADVLLPYALAGAMDPAAVDTLLLRYATSLEAGGSCGDALLAYRAVLRRRRAPDLAFNAQAGAARCGTRLGGQTLAAGDATAAERWFSLAVVGDTTGPDARQAFLGLGRSRVARGDTAGARAAFAAAAGTSGDEDSTGRAARAQLRVLDSLQTTGDTARRGQP